MPMPRLINDPERSLPAPPGVGRLGVLIFLASLAVLFVASLVGYMYVRLSAAAWPPDGMPALPKGLWVSTLVILATSMTVQSALTAVRKGDQPGLKRWLTITFVLGLVFLGLQGVNWATLIGERLTAKTNLYGLTFYFLTGLHAAHVIGGLISLLPVTLKAQRGLYSMQFHPGVEYSALYWHFLDGVWIVMFLVMFVFG